MLIVLSLIFKRQGSLIVLFSFLNHEPLDNQAPLLLQYFVGKIFKRKVSKKMNLKNKKNRLGFRVYRVADLVAGGKAILKTLVECVKATLLLTLYLLKLLRDVKTILLQIIINMLDACIYCLYRVISDIAQILLNSWYRILKCNFNPINIIKYVTYYKWKKQNILSEKASRILKELESI